MGQRRKVGVKRTTPNVLKSQERKKASRARNRAAELAEAGGRVELIPGLRQKKFAEVQAIVNANKPKTYTSGTPSSSHRVESDYPAWSSGFSF